MPEYRATPGNQGAWVLRRIVAGRAEFITLTFWDSLDAVRAFAGDDHGRAVYYPEDTRFLLEMLPTVEHYELHPAE